MSQQPSDVAVASVSEAGSRRLGPHRSVSSSTVPPAVAMPSLSPSKLNTSTTIVPTPTPKPSSNATPSGKPTPRGGISHPNSTKPYRDLPRIKDLADDRDPSDRPSDRDRTRDGRGHPDRGQEKVAKEPRSDRDRRVDMHRASNATRTTAGTAGATKIENPRPSSNAHKKAASNTKAPTNRSSISTSRDRRAPRKLGIPAAPRGALPTAPVAGGGVGATSRGSGGSDASAGSAGSAVRSVRSAGSAGGASHDAADDADKGEGDDDDDADNDDGDDADGADGDDGADDEEEPDDEDADEADDDDEVDADPDAEIEADPDGEEDDEEVGNGDAGGSKEGDNLEEEGEGDADVKMDDVDGAQVNESSQPAGTATMSAAAAAAAAAEAASFRKRAMKSRLMYGSRELAAPLLLSATMDEYREGCLKLEKARHARVYEAEKRLMHLEQMVVATYRTEADQIHHDHMIIRRAAVKKALIENAQRIRRLERRRYGVAKDDGNDASVGGNGGSGSGTGAGDAGNGAPGTGGGGGASNGAGLGTSRRHDMELRGRDDKLKSEDDGGLDAGEKPRKTRKAENKQQKVKVTLELEELDIMADLAELRGEKRPREPDPPPASTLNLPDRRVKKKKGAA